MSVFNRLLEISAYASVIVLAILMVRWLLGKWLSPALKYALWFVLIARLLLPVTFDGGVRLFTLPGEVAVGSSVVATQAEKEEQPTVFTETNPDGAIAPAVADAAAANPSAEPKQALTIQQIAAIVWLAGAALTGGWMIVSYAVLRQKIRRDAAAPTERLLALLEETKVELRVRGNVRLACAYTCGAPAMVFPRILFVPLGALISMREDEIRHMLRHELTHDRRFDPIVSVLLAAFCALHWFNPLIWLAVRLMRADMETACDAEVTQRYTPQEKEGYATLLLSLYALPALGAPALGLSGRGVAKQAQKRVYGVYQASKSAPLCKVAVLLISLLLVFGCFTTACQPAGNTSGHVFDQNNPWISDVPTRVITHLKQGAVSLTDNVTFTVDADATEPLDTKPEIVSIARRELDETTFQTLLNAAMPDVAWTISTTMEGAQLNATGERNGEPYIAFGNMGANGSNFSIYPENVNMICEGYFANDIEMEQVYSKAIHRPIQTTAAEARPLADAVVRALGAEGMMLQAAERACRFGTAKYDDDTVLTSGWCFLYVPSCGGLPAFYRGSGTQYGAAFGTDSYGMPMEPILRIYVDETGVSVVDWRDMSTVTGTTERTDEINGYEEALASAKQLLQNRYSNERDAGKLEVTVTAVQLSAAVVSDERMSGSAAFDSRASTGRILPVWDVICRLDRDNSYQETFALRFSATDGARPSSTQKGDE